MPVSLRDHLAMWWRKVPSWKVSRALATIAAAGGAISLEALEAHYLAGGEMQACADAMRTVLEVSADADWCVITAADLVGLDVVAIAHEAVRQRRPLIDIYSERVTEHFAASDHLSQKENTSAQQ